MSNRAGQAAVLLAAMMCAAAAHAEFPAELGTVEGRVIWVDFWASWCTPCRRSFPWLNAMQRKYADQGLEIIGVNLDKQRKPAIEFLNETPAAFTIRFDPDGSLAETFDVQAMPSSFLLDASGKVVASHYGFKLADRADYEQSIKDALRDAASKE